MLEPKNQQKKEALTRMKVLRIDEEIIGQFELSDSVSCCNSLLDESLKKYVSDFEESHGYLVYYSILSYTSIGRMLSLFYVSNHEEEWSIDMSELRDGVQLCYVFNLDYPDCSEFGHINFQPLFGGLIRTA